MKNGFEEYPVEKEGMMDKRCSRMQAWGYWYGGCRLVRENGYEEFGGYEAMDLMGIGACMMTTCTWDMRNWKEWNDERNGWCGVFKTNEKGMQCGHGDCEDVANKFSWV